MSEIDFPHLINLMIDGLNNKLRRQILIRIDESGPLAHKELLEKTGLDKGTLNYHLKILNSSGILTNYLDDNLDDNYSSYYDITHFGRKMIQAIFDIFEPDDVAVMENSGIIDEKKALSQKPL